MLSLKGNLEGTVAGAAAQVIVQRVVQREPAGEALCLGAQDGIADEVSALMSTSASSSTWQ
jgi:hypothetical protein